MDLFAKEEKYGNRRRVLERALELLEALEEADVSEILEAYKIRRRLIELLDFVLVSNELIEALANVALGRSGVKTLFEKIREYTATESETSRKVLARVKVNSFLDMVESITFYHKHLNIIGRAHVNEDQRQVFAKLHAFKPIPEIPLEILNTLLEVSGYTFNLRLEGGNNPILTFTWVPPDDYPQVREQREKYINSRREALIAGTE